METQVTEKAQEVTEAATMASESRKAERKPPKRAAVTEGAGKARKRVKGRGLAAVLARTELSDDAKAAAVLESGLKAGLIVLDSEPKLHAHVSEAAKALIAADPGCSYGPGGRYVGETREDAEGAMNRAQPGHKSGGKDAPDVVQAARGSSLYLTDTGRPRLHVEVAAIGGMSPETGRREVAYALLAATFAEMAARHRIRGEKGEPLAQGPAAAFLIASAAGSKAATGIAASVSSIARLVERKGGAETLLGRAFHAMLAAFADPIEGEPFAFPGASRATTRGRSAVVRQEVTVEIPNVVVKEGRPERLKGDGVASTVKLKVQIPAKLAALLDWERFDGFPIVFEGKRSVLTVERGEREGTTTTVSGADRKRAARRRAEAAA